MYLERVVRTESVSLNDGGRSGMYNVSDDWTSRMDPCGLGGLSYSDDRVLRGAVFYSINN